jgi:hypothetical protein
LRVAPVVTKLSHDVQQDEIVEFPASFQTPEEPGRYILVLELFSDNLKWFSQGGVVPVLIEADILPDTSRAVTQTDLSSLYQRGQTQGALTTSVPRSVLWTAALRMFIAHPFGVGPDNFRLRYGTYAGAQRWNTGVYSNNLYLELLTGSGILGLAAFGFMIGSLSWHAKAASLAIGIFLVHGLVDVFLMTTPIYFAFWIVCGVVGPLRRTDKE